MPSLLRISFLAAMLALALALALSACNGRAALPVSAGIGAEPELPPPDQGLVPTGKTAAG